MLHSFCIQDSRLIDFLIAEGMSLEASEKIVNALQPFFRQAESGQFVFGPRPESETDMLASYKLVTGRTIARVVYISASNPYSKPEWMKKDSYRESVGIAYKNTMMEILRFVFGDSRMSIFGYRLTGGLLGEHEKSLQKSYQASVCKRFAEDLWDFFYIGFAHCVALFRNGDDEQAENLLSLLKYFSTTPILGEMADDQNVLLVLVE